MKNVYNNCIILILKIELIEFIYPNLILNNIIGLGGDNFRYNHFSFNANEDMIIDSSSYPTSSERIFFGLKNNGKFVFKDIYYSIFLENDETRYEGESYFITLTNNNEDENERKELLCDISKYNCLELYDLNNNESKKYSITENFGNIISNSFTIMKMPDESFYYYILTCIIQDSDSTDSYYLKNYKIYFSNDGYNINELYSKKAISQKVSSCFYTVNLNYICFYFNENTTLSLIVFNSDISELKELNLHHPTIYFEDIFFKGIHLKGEIGFFIYFKERDIGYPVMSLLEYDNINNEIKIYNNFYEININKTTFNKESMLNDIIRLNDFQICYISTSWYKTTFSFVVFTLYKDDTLINIRYYEIKLWENYSMKLFLDLRGSLYKNFISIIFSNCLQEDCNYNSDLHYSSLIILNYPNNTDNSLDIISELYYTNKKIDNGFIFNFEGTLIIENNLFGYVYKGTKILNYPNDIHLKNITNQNIIEFNSILSIGENISLYFNSLNNYEIKNYTIEYAYILKEPDYDDINNNNYLTYIDDSYGNKIEDEKNYYKYYEYIGKSSNFTIIISDNIKTNCNDLCDLCFINYTCITCRYNYDFINNIKTCLSNSIIHLNKEIICDNNPSILCLEEDIDRLLKNIETFNIIQTNSGKTINIYNSEENLENLKMAYKNISFIYLGECSEKLKKSYNLPLDTKLYILGINSPFCNDSSPINDYIFEIFLENGTQLKDLSVCNDVEVYILPYIKNKEAIKFDKSIEFYNLGYNIYNKSDIFYTDNCAPASDEGNDITLSDRMKFYYPNVSICNEGCEYNDMDIENERIVCKCYLGSNDSNIEDDDVESNEDYLDYFLSLINYKIILCYKLFITFSSFYNNFGFYTSFITLIIRFILMNIFWIKSPRKFRLIFYNNIPNLFSSQQFLKKKEEKKENSSFKQDNKRSSLNNYNILKNINSYPPNRRKNNINIMKFKDSHNISLKTISSDNMLYFKSSEEFEKKENIQNIYNNKLINISENKNNSKKPNFYNNNNIHVVDEDEQLTIDFNFKHLIDINDNDVNKEEINNVPYTQALRVDKRNIFQIFISVIKNEIGFLNLYFYKNPYSHFSLDISIYLFELLLDLTMNCILYSDDVVSEKYNNNGELSMVTTLTLSIVSGVISSFIVFIISYLVNYVEIIEAIINNVKDKKYYYFNVIRFFKYIKVKLGVYYLFEFIVIIFMTYYLFIFCTVYHETQGSILINYVTGAFISLITSVGIAIIISLLRIISIKYKNVRLFNISKYLYEHF